MRGAIGAGLVMTALFFGSAARAGEIDFIEDFALGDDRAKALLELVPGTDEHFYYTCLHLENEGRLDEAEEALAQWVKRHGYTARAEEMRNRQALLRFEKDPRATLEFLKWRLGIKLDHEREVIGQKAAYPARLDPALYSRETLEKRAFELYGDLSGFEASALDFLAAERLDGDRRRALLARLERPDVPGLARLVVDDLKYQPTQQFGAYAIHRALLLSQLDECLALMPGLKGDARFVQVYLTKLQPAPDTDWRSDPKAREQFLDRLWAFVGGLAQAQNSLKAHVLYHRLAHDRAQGIYDRARFLEYLAIPRAVAYMNTDYMRRAREPAQLAASFEEATLLPPVRDDEPLVHDYLLHFLAAEEDARAFAPFLADRWLKDALAEAKLLAGAPDKERWYSLLGDPAKIQALKDRVDIEFAPSSRAYFRADEAVSLDVDVKNVKTLIVKVFEIDTTSWYRSERKEIDLAANLDGLVANEEKTYTYDETAERRVRRRFDFPSLARRGAFVVELIGNGRSSRALVRKGQLRFVERASAAGHVFTIFDDANRKVADASIFLGGREHRAGNDGTILVPYTASPGVQPIVITQDGFSTLDRFEQRAEEYSLRAGIYVDREALLKGAKAKVVVRPTLALDGVPVALSLLESPSLVVQAVDRDGVPSSKEIEGLTLTADREYVHEFQVPDGLAELRFTLKGKVASISAGKKIDLADGAAFGLNRIDATDKVEDLHVARTAAGYLLFLLGKNGEAKPDRPIAVSLKHRDFCQPVDVTLETDAAGRVDLGALEGIDWFRATGPEGTAHRWYLERDRHTYPAAVHGRAGEAIAVPYMGKATEASAAAFSLLETRGETFVADWRKALAVEDGFVLARGLPAGSYSLVMKESGTAVSLEVADGEAKEGRVLGECRILEPRARPLQIAAVEAGASEVRVRLKNAGAATRVHVVATRFLPAYAVYDPLAARPAEPEVVHVQKDESFYVSGRDIGDEYRYILERRYAKKYPGNMLARPGLLLNPWALRDTDVGFQGAEGGGVYGGRFGAKRPLGARGGGGAISSEPDGDVAFANLDFLAEPATTVWNLAPAADGTVTIARKDLGAAQHLHVVAVSPDGAAYRAVALPEAKLAPRDLRLRSGLDPAKHFTEQKQTTLVAAGDAFVLGDITTSRLETYDSLRRVYGLMATISKDATLAEFAFVLDWPRLSPAEKREKYSKYACHELSFFLSRKDPVFFEEVVRPYLANKKEKTFLDRYLLREDLGRFREPWAYGELNVVERILLAGRLPGEPPATARHVQDLFDLIPPSIEDANRLFETAIAGSALDTGDALGMDKARQRVEKKKMGEEQHAAASGAAAGPAGMPPPAPPPPASTPAPEPAAKPSPAKTEAAPEEKAAETPAEPHDESGELGKQMEADVARRATVRPYYRKLEATKEWAENHYWHVLRERRNADLITANGFWNDLARHVETSGGPFFSPRFPEATRSFAEMMLALALLDLPLESPGAETAFDGARMTLRPKGATVVFHKEVKESAPSREAAPVLVGETCFRASDRYRWEGGERFDKVVADEFLTRTAYGCQVVVTNPTGSRRKLEVLLQIPRGAVPLQNGFETRGLDVRLEPYATATFEYLFYFPEAGTFAHYPVHVAQNGQYLASAPAATLRVVETPTRIDRASWDYVSQSASPEDVLAFLDAANLDRLALERIAWRVRDQAFFQKTLALLARRHVYSDVLWSYGILHGDRPAIREYLKHAQSFVAQVGPRLESPLLSVDPIERRAYEHLEYSPLVNARAHPLGKRRTILNARLSEQYHAFLAILAYEPRLDDLDCLAAAYYLLLQDRIEEAGRFFARVDPAKVATRIQYDYMQAYLDLYTPERKLARAIAGRYAGYPVDRWRKLFLDVTAELDEAEGRGGAVVDVDSREQVQARLAASEASFDFTVEAKRVTINYQNLAECRVNYYLMDVELLFSRNPFVQQRGGQFALVKPNRSEAVRFPEGRTSFAFDLPEELRSSNIMVEVVAGGAKKSAAYFAHALAVKTVESYGQVRVTREAGGAPLAGVYAKVYARMRDGSVRFYKDGYTDIRGIFDYASLSTGELGDVERFAVLVLSETDGAVIREVEPPKQ
jgi:hypothetical protein